MDLRLNMDAAAQAALRRKAETVSQERVPGPGRSGVGCPPLALDPEGEQMRLVHELQVHQIELELQNEALREAQSDALLGAAVFTHSYDGIFICDSEGCMLEVNPAFTRITGYSPKEARGQTTRLLAPDEKDDFFHDEMKRFLLVHGFWRGEVNGRRRSGAACAQILSLAAVHGRDGEVVKYVGVLSDISLIKAHEAELDLAAHYDPLTGLPNRRLFADRFQQALARSRRSGKPLAVCYLDLDGFKQINDRHGHASGDQLLVAVSRSLQGALRAEDSMARIGGDEFVLLLELEAEPEFAVALERVRSAVRFPWRVEGREIDVTASIGVTLFPQDDADADTLLRHADQAMYTAKDRGGNGVHRFDLQQGLAARTRVEHKARLEEALRLNEFVLHYQPKVDLFDGRVVGVEALVRWQHPELGLLPPVGFLGWIEDSSLDEPLGEWVIDAALRQIADWQAAGLTVVCSVNISPRHLLLPHFASRLADLLRRHGEVSPGLLELEILESAALSDLARAAETLESCKRLGVRFSLDDFGTGYSSLAMLRHLPVDVLKIDQSFVRDMLTDRSDLALVASVVRLAETFEREVIAEGVETRAHGEALLAIGCRLCQGYHIARPMPGAGLPLWAAQWQASKGWMPKAQADVGAAVACEAVGGGR